MSAGDEDDDAGDDVAQWEVPQDGGGTFVFTRVKDNRRMASAESLAKQADAELKKKKEPVAKKFDAATATPSESVRAEARALHATQTALAQNTRARITAAPPEPVGVGALPTCDQPRQDEADTRTDARTDEKNSEPV